MLSKLKQSLSVVIMGTMLCAIGATGAHANSQVVQTPLLGKNIPKYVEPLPTFVGARVQAGTGYSVSMEEFDQQVLPAANPVLGIAGFPKTTVWGYKVGNMGPLWPGYTVEAQKGAPVTVTYLNALMAPKLQKYLTVDQTLHWADPLQQFCTFKMVNCVTTPADPCCKPYGNPNLVAPGNPLNPPGAPVPTSVHLHGAEVKSDFDGGPDQWFTPTGLRGPAFRSYSSPAPANGTVYHYPNSQEATTLFFHDHALGSTRTNVYSGLAAFYWIRDARDTGLPTNPIGLPASLQEIELAIQDRMFDTTGQLLFPDLGLNPAVHPYWIPEFFGDVITVNGKSWPFLKVDPQRYRFRIVNGSNARFYNLKFDNKMIFWQIGTDGGLLDAPVPVTQLLIAPGERADIIVDFAGLPNANIVLTNDAKAPFPAGRPADPQTIGQIMQFQVGPTIAGFIDPTCVPGGVTTPCNLRAAPIVRLVNPVTGIPTVTPSVIRQLTLKEVMGPAGPLEVLLNNTKWSGLKESTMMIATPTKIPDSFASSYTVPKPAGVSGDAGLNWLTEGPRVGDTEQWEIINMTADAHPIHLHLVQFQLMNRQPFQAKKYLKDWSAAFLGGVMLPGEGPPYNYSNSNNLTIPPAPVIPIVGGNVYVGPYLQGAPTPPLPNEAGWKDTVVMYPGEVTRIMVRWTQQGIPVPASCATPGTPGCAGVNTYPFDPTNGPGYVWHCHIIDHEDNEMMRPYEVKL